MTLWSRHVKFNLQNNRNPLVNQDGVLLHNLRPDIILVDLIPFGLVGMDMAADDGGPMPALRFRVTVDYKSLVEGAVSRRACFKRKRSISASSRGLPRRGCTSPCSPVCR
jgi:hypothetical protein